MASASNTEGSNTSVNGTGYFLSLDEILEMSPPEWLVRGLVPKGGVGIVYGPSGSLKSFFALHLAASCATGRAAFTDMPCQQVDAFYIAAEGASGFRLRVDAWIKYHGIRPERLFIKPSPVYIDQAEMSAKLIEEIKNITSLTGSDKHCLIVIDTLSANFTGRENTDDTANFLRKCSEISKDTNATILVVHHTGKDEKKEERGHYSLRANADFSLRMDADSDGAKVQPKKFKDAPLGHTLFLAKKSIEVNPGGEFPNSLVLMEADDFEAKLSDNERVFQEALHTARGQHTDELTQQSLAHQLKGAYEWSVSTANRKIQDAFPEDKEVTYENHIFKRSGKGSHAQKIITVMAPKEARQV